MNINPDDQLAALIVDRFMESDKDFPTLTKITACYNIVIRLLTLCSVSGREEDLVQIANEFHDGLLTHIADLYEGKKTNCKKARIVRW